MILDVVRLLFFPALMAFAAASDLFTMTISNRVSLALAAGFLALALASGMAPSDILMHLAAGATVLAGPYSVSHGDTAIVRFPGGYLVEIHALDSN